jgi:predicted DNA binding CopG/RHH family protein
MEQRRRGRPRAEHPSEKMDIRLSRPVFDAVCRVAVRRGVPAATLIRQLLERQFLPGDKSEVRQMG